ncbi:MAG: sensor histidine kinase [Spirochaetes bacterium]|nr:sensor histidine kinase [Spirochaetota bacterium]
MIMITIPLIINLASVLIYSSAMVLLTIAVFLHKIYWKIAFFLMFCLFSLFIVTLFNSLSLTGVVDNFDLFEEYFEILIIPYFLLYIFMFSSFKEISKRKNREIKLKKLVSERTVLIKEIHHRVKNNLQTVAALIEMQLDKLENSCAVKELTTINNRIRSMGLLYTMLCRSDNLANVDAGMYIRSVAGYIVESFHLENRIKIEVKTANFIFPIDYTIIFGLIINEMVTNSIKHAFKDEQSGEIYISLEKGGDSSFYLVVRDNGAGFNENPQEHKGLGLVVVEALVRQIEGELSLNHNKGTTWEIKFSL